jgi:hypothetical protein
VLCARLPLASAQRKVPVVECGPGQYMDITNFKCYDCSSPPNVPTDSALLAGLQARVGGKSIEVVPL